MEYRKFGETVYSGRPRQDKKKERPARGLSYSDNATVQKDYSYLSTLMPMRFFVQMTS